VVYVPHVSLRVSEQEKSIMESYAKHQGVNLSDVLKDAFFEKLEDEYDLKVIREYEEKKAKGNMTYYSLEKVKNVFGLDE
jgi:predicted DNA-binding protein